MDALLVAQFDIPILERLARPFGLIGLEFAAIASVLAVSAVCGMIGPLVIGNRMAFFSDAMTHCAFAGVSLGLAIAIGLGQDAKTASAPWLVPLAMAIFGATVGVGIAFVKNRTQLAGDTVIGIFFAGSIGVGAVVLSIFRSKKVFDPERFLFGSPYFAQASDLLFLAMLLLLTVLFVLFRQNSTVLASFNSSLARSRGAAVTFDNYVFIILLALVVNFSICAVGTLLINAMLLVPAATACNLTVNMRQMFRWSLGISLFTGAAGLWLSQQLSLTMGGEQVRVGVSGSIICLGVLLFVASMAVPAIRYRFRRLG